MKEFKRVKFINPSNSIESFSLRAAAIITIDDKFLLVRNEGEKKYKLPGGHLDIDESLSAGLKRELAEEIGLSDILVPSEPDFYDQVVIKMNLMIDAYFYLGDFKFDEKTFVESTPLPSKLFRIEELNLENSFESEIRAIETCLKV